MVINEEVLQEKKRKTLAMSSVNETVAMCIEHGAKVLKIGLPKNGKDIFSLWVSTRGEENKVIIIPNIEWNKFSALEKEEIELTIEEMVKEA